MAPEGRPFPAQPGLGGAWESPRPGPCSIPTEVQPGTRILRPFREVFEPLVIAVELFLDDTLWLVVRWPPRGVVGEGGEAPGLAGQGD